MPAVRLLHTGATGGRSMTRQPRDRLTDTHVQLANPDWDIAAAPGPRAQREQASSGEYDQLMTNLARQNHPTVAWWWGFRRHALDGHVAVCYVCDQTITAVRPNGLTGDHRAAILDHRATHWADMRDRIGD